MERTSWVDELNKIEERLLQVEAAIKRLANPPQPQPYGDIGQFLKGVNREDNIAAEMIASGMNKK